jgi:hypothetical protein
MSPTITSSKAYLFHAPDAVAWRYSGATSDKFTGDNPPNGAVFYYWLKDEPKGDITVDVLDSSNKVIDTLSSKPKPVTGIGDDLKQEEEDAKKAALPKAAGFQVGTWPMTYSGGEMVTGAKVFGSAVTGPSVPAGNYTLRLNVEGKTYTQALKVTSDPRVHISEADLKEQQQLALSLRDDVTQLTQIVRQIRSTRQQLKARNELLNSNPKAAGLIKDSDALIQKLDALEAKLHNPKAEVVYDLFSFKGGAQLYSRIASLYSYATDSDGRPTEAMISSATEQREELNRYKSDWQKLQSEDLANLNRTAKNLEVPTVIVPQY